MLVHLRLLKGWQGWLASVSVLKILARVPFYRLSKGPLQLAAPEVEQMSLKMLVWRVSQVFPVRGFLSTNLSPLTHSPGAPSDPQMLREMSESIHIIDVGNK